ncbi:MAG TPA: globin domain-containing protein [Kineosporiaceae bacterium]|nr:globin domain-containing protein [Kineosporiaceae bacterium]
MVQQSIQRFHGREMELTTGFYSHLFSMLPAARALFPEDMAEQRVQLLKALLASVDSLVHDPAGMEIRLQALGGVHYQRGIADDQYQYVAHALVRTVRDVMPGDWSTWLSSAWISVYSWMISHMEAGARQARQRDEAGIGQPDLHLQYQLGGTAQQHVVHQYPDQQYPDQQYFAQQHAPHQSAVQPAVAPQYAVQDPDPAQVRYPAQPVEAVQDPASAAAWVQERSPAVPGAPWSAGPRTEGHPVGVLGTSGRPAPGGPATVPAGEPVLVAAVDAQAGVATVFPRRGRRAGLV